MAESITLTEPESGPDAPLEAEETLQQEPSAPSERPEWLPEKFGSPEDMAQAYQSLEKKLSSRQAEEKGLLTDADFQEYSQEYSENGSLSDKTYADLAKKGLSRELVDNYIEGQSQMQDAEVTDLMNLAGGEETYGAMTEWMSESLDQEDIDAFNEAVEGSNAVARMAIKGMYSQYLAAGGIGGSPDLVQGTRAPKEGGYGSMYEMQKDMMNPLYKAGDSQFHAMVERRLAMSGDLT